VARVTFVSTATLLVLALSPLPAAAQALSGTWLTQDGSSRVEFKPCGMATCGRIVWLQEPMDAETHKPLVDKFNPDDALKSRPLLGVPIVEQVTPTGDQTFSAKLYNPEDGNSYSGAITLAGPDQMQLKGCALAGLVCQSETWTRAKP
jgi:uncharacterized protein (DUF2147 family)